MIRPLLLILLAGLAVAEEPAERFVALVEAMAPDAAGERMALARELAADPPREALRAIDKARRSAAREVGAVLDPKIAGGIARLVAQRIAPLREELLDLVMDEQRYPESKSPQAQAEVDRLVGAIRAQWDDPVTAAAAAMPDLGERLAAAAPAYATLRELDALRAVLDPEAEPAPDLGGDLNAALAALVAQAQTPPAWRAIRAANAEAAYLHEQELAHLRIVNDYRIMLGLNPVESDVRLWRAAFGHSRDMAEKNFFSHDSPIPGKRSPGDRAKLEGYAKYSGENIYRGGDSGQAAFDAWYGSPGHHRNMLRAKQVQLGVGRYQGRWTQLFGVDGPYAGKRKPPRLVLEEEIAALPADCPVERRVALAQQAAGAKLLAIAEQQLAIAAEQAPEDERIRAALGKVREALGR